MTISHPRWWRSVRTRALISAISLAALSVIFAGVVAYSLERNRIEQTAQSELFAQLDAAQMMSARGRDPLSGSAFADAEGVLTAIVDATVVSQAQGAIAFDSDGVIATSRSTTSNQLANDQQFLDIVAAQPADESPRIENITTKAGTYRVVLLDVHQGGTSGRVVFAYIHQQLYRSINDTYRTYVVVATGSILLFGFVAWLSIGRLLAPIHVMQRTVQRVNNTDPSHRIPVKGNDDLTDLAVNINEMLDRLAVTFADQQEFYDDVSHELRTPLTIVRGNLELLATDDPDEVKAVRTRAISELDRMNLLVDDMMTLAKSGRPDFANLRPTDVGDLTDMTFDKARSLGDRHWVLDDLTDAEAMLDPRRIEQALLELCRNAVKFTETGDVVALGSGSSPDHITFWVRDEGIGIDPEQIPLLTKRRVRGSQSSRREGQGLGLAIVESIAVAHGGQLLISSELGKGTTVTIELPTPQGG